MSNSPKNKITQAINITNLCAGKCVVPITYAYVSTFHVTMRPAGSAGLVDPRSSNWTKTCEDSSLNNKCTP